MIDICDTIQCTGCMACSNICPQNAISFKADDEGFKRPVINQGLCINCKLCAKVCPANIYEDFNYPKSVYSGWIDDSAIRYQSSSGGAFSAIAIAVLQQSGIVYGASLNQNLQVEHIGISTFEDLSKLRGSKYVQSEMGTVYQDIRQELISGRKVLFTGTPCQVAALKRFLGKPYDNLLTVDVICHGVPSPKVFEDWKTWFKEKNALKDITSINFRGKRSSWIFFRMSVNGHTVKDEDFNYDGEYYKDSWIRGFLRDYFLRPSCHSCKYAKIERSSDITIADWWGYKPLSGETSDFEQMGVSLVLCNTEKGCDFFKDNVSMRMNIRQRSIEEAVKTNPALKHPFDIPNNRAKFWSDYKTMTFDDINNKYFQSERLALPHYVKYKMKNSALRGVIIWLSYKIIRVAKRLGLRDIKIKV